MAVVAHNLSGLLSAIAGARARLPAIEAGDQPLWSDPELVSLLRVGEATALLAWSRRLGQQAAASGLATAQAAALAADVATTAVDLARQALGDGATSELLHHLARPVQGEVLAGYLDHRDGTPPQAPPGPPPTRGDVEGRLEKMEALHRINRAANSSVQLSAMLDMVVEAVADVLASDTCSVWILDETTDELVMRAARGLNPAALGRVRLRLGEAITGEAARTRQAIAAREAATHPAYRFIPLLNEERYRSQVSIPIVRYSTDRLVGVMTLKTVQPRDFDRDDIRFLRTVAAELANAIENAQFYQQTDDQLRERVRELNMLQRISARMAETLDQAEVLTIIATSAAELSSAELVRIFELDEAGQATLIASHGVTAALPELHATVEREVIQELNRTLQSVGPAGFGGMVGLTSALPPRQAGGPFAIFGMPLRTVRRLLGVICFHYAEDAEPTEQQASLLASFANAAAIAIDNAHLFAEAQRNVHVSATLLREMHHRVRNNLQQTAGLLRLQLRRVAEPTAAAALQQAVARIQSIAAVHDLLTRDQLGSTTVTDVARRIVDEANASLTPPGSHLRYHVGGSGPRVSAREATLLAVIITELTANAVRHGLRDRDEGDIWVESASDDGHIVVTVADNGAGLPVGFSAERDAGLGLQIVRSLVSSDLAGTVSVTSRPDGGSLMTVRFPASAAETDDTTPQASPQ